MSRGLGKQQASILRRLAMSENPKLFTDSPGPHSWSGPARTYAWTDVRQLVPQGRALNPPARSSVRRSVRELERRGLVEVDHGGQGRRNRARLTWEGIEVSRAHPVSGGKPPQGRAAVSITGAYNGCIPENGPGA